MHAKSSRVYRQNGRLLAEKFKKCNPLIAQGNIPRLQETSFVVSTHKRKNEKELKETGPNVREDS